MPEPSGRESYEKAANLSPEPTRLARPCPADRAWAICSSLEGVSPWNPEVDEPHFRREIDRQIVPGDPPLQRQSFGFYLQSLRREYNGLKFYDGENLIPLAFGLNGLAAVAINPMGPKSVTLLAEIANVLMREGIQLFLKKVHPRDEVSFAAQNFIRADFTSDFNPEDLPDDVFPEVITDCSDCRIELPGDKWGDTRRSVRKLFPDLSHRLSWCTERPSYRWFDEIPDFDQARIPGVPPYFYLDTRRNRFYVGTTDCIGDAEVVSVQAIHALLREWAASKSGAESEKARQYSSSYDDIINFLSTSNGLYAAAMKNNDPDRDDTLDGFAACERLGISKQTGWALQCNLVNRVPGLPETVLLALMTEVLTEHRISGGTTLINLGGSETSKLHFYKMKFGPSQEAPQLYLKYGPPGQGD